MTVLPSVLLLIDLSAVMTDKAHQWQEYWRVGKCYLPQVVYEEIQFLCNRAPEPNQEQTAREFVRFYFSSGWHLTTAHASHPTLAPASGQMISKRARLSLATAQCAYGLSQEHQDKLVVFVANNQPMLQRIQDLNASNLCGMTTTALLQWSRTEQRPPAVTQKMQATSKGVELLGMTQAQGLTYLSPQRTSSKSRPVSSRPPMAEPASAAKVTRVPSRQRAAAGSPSRLIFSILILAGMAIASLIVWRTIQPASFNQVWRQLGLPSQPRANPQKPVYK